MDRLVCLIWSLPFSFLSRPLHCFPAQQENISRKIVTYSSPFSLLPLLQALLRRKGMISYSFCCSHHFVIWVPSNSALSYMINSCHMWLVLSDPLCRGRTWAFAREKETYVGFKSTVQMKKKDWSQIFAGWLPGFLKLFISYEEELRNSYKIYLYRIGNSRLFTPLNSPGS